MLQLLLVCFSFRVLFSAYFLREDDLLRENEDIVHHTRTHLQNFALDLKSVDLLEQVKKIRKYVADVDSPEQKIQDVIESGAVPDLINILQDKERLHDIRFESAWALTNIASGNSVQTQLIVDLGAVETFADIVMGYENENILFVEQAVWALGNIAGDCAALRDKVLSTGILLDLLRLIQNSDGSLVANATWFLSNLCRGKPHVDFHVLQPALPIMLELMQHKNEEIYIDLAWALSYLSDDPSNTNNRIQAIIDHGFVPFLIKWLNNSDASVVHPALRTIGNLVAGSDSQTQSVIDEGFLQNVKSLLKHEKRSIRKETCWALSNIAAGSIPQIDLLFEFNLLEHVVALMHDEVYEVKKEALWVISNISASKKRHHILYVMKCGAIEGIMSLLATMNIRIGRLCFGFLETALDIVISERIGEDRMTTPHALNTISEYISYHKLDEKIQKRGMNLFNKILNISQLRDRRSSDSAAYRSELR